MKILNVIVEKSESNYSAFIHGVDGIAVTGTIEELKKKMLEAICVFIEECNSLKCDIPEELVGKHDFRFIVKCNVARPKHLSEERLMAFLDDEAQWVIDNGYCDSCPSDEKESVVRDLKKLVPFDEDGFYLAQKLDSCHSEASYENIDSSFIEFLESLSYRYDSLLSKMVEEWAVTNAIEPAFAIGDKISFSDKFAERIRRHYKSSDNIFITGIEKEQARYIINEDRKAIGSGMLFAYEDLEENAICV